MAVRQDITWADRVQSGLLCHYDGCCRRMSMFTPASGGSSDNLLGALPGVGFRDVCVYVAVYEGYAGEVRSE